MNFSFVGFGVAGNGGKCMSCLQAGEYNMITNKQTSPTSKTSLLNGVMFTSLTQSLI